MNEPVINKLDTVEVKLHQVMNIIAEFTYKKLNSTLLLAYDQPPRI